MTLVYNQFEFPDRSHVKVGVHPVYDESDRVVIGKRIVFDVTAIIAPRGEGDPPVTEPSALDHMQAVRDALETPGKSLYFSGLGFPRLLVNDPVNATGNTRDIRSGPKPRVLQWMSLGADQAAEITWQCETVISPCESAFEGVASFVYSLAFNYRRNGFCTRRMTGHLTVAQSTIDGDSTASADDYRELVQIARIPNWHREQDFALSADKSRLDFTITDSEIESPNAYPAGVVSISAPVRSRIPFPNPRAVYVTNNFSVRLELEAFTPRVRAWEIFRDLLAARVAGLIAQELPVVVREITIAENSFTHEYDFGVTFTTSAPFNMIIAGLGYFQPLALSWLDWQVGMTNAQSHRGISHITHTKTDRNDRHVTLCEPDTPEIDHIGIAAQPLPSTFYMLCNTPPPPDRSWLVFNSRIIEAIETETAWQSTYGDVTLEQVGFAPGASDGENPTLSVTEYDYEQSFAQAPPRQVWIWKGYAQRIAYPIPPLGKLTLGGKTARIVGNPRIMRRQIGVMFCLAVYEAAWSIALVLEETPESITKDDIDPTGTTNPEESES